MYCFFLVILSRLRSMSTVEDEKKSDLVIKDPVPSDIDIAHR